MTETKTLEQIFAKKVDEKYKGLSTTHLWQEVIKLISESKKEWLEQKRQEITDNPILDHKEIAQETIDELWRS